MHWQSRNPSHERSHQISNRPISPADDLRKGNIRGFLFCVALFVLAIFAISMFSTPRP